MAENGMSSHNNGIWSPDSIIVIYSSFHTIIDLSGVPSSVLSITILFISRLLFEHGNYFKKSLSEDFDITSIFLLI